MPDRPSGRRRWLIWTVVAVVLLAAAVLSHWLTDDPDRTSIATMFFTMTGSLASMVAALHAVLDRRSRHHSESPSEACRERLAEAIRGEVGDVIITGCSGIWDLAQV